MGVIARKNNTHFLFIGVDNTLHVISVEIFAMYLEHVIEID